MRNSDGLVDVPLVLAEAARRHHRPEDVHDDARAQKGRDVGRIVGRRYLDEFHAAEALGVHKSTLYRKCKALGILLPDKDGRVKQK